MDDLSKVGFTGPLRSCREELITEFTRLGYAPSTTARHLHLVNHLSSWMALHQVNAGDLSWDHVASFCSDSSVSCVNRFAPPGVMVLMRLVRPGCEPARRYSPGLVLPADLDHLLELFAAYLSGERALASTTVEGYERHARVFARWYLDQRGADLGAVVIADVNAFLIAQVAGKSESSVHGATVTLRALFRWMFLIGRIERNVAVGIVSGRQHLWSEMPRALPLPDIVLLLAAAMSVRDRAVLLLLVRLGLRAGEVSRLRLEDFDWRAGTVRIHGKADDRQLMPLTEEVGEAIAAYLAQGRPADSLHRQVFLSRYTPIRPLSSSGVSAVVTYVARRAGISGRVGSHRLRHSAATAVLAAGGTLAEVGQLLRHRSTQATVIYARSDQDTLTQLARPWPGSAFDGEIS